MQGYNYREFSPGNNIWKKQPRLLFLNFERLAVLGGFFMFTYIMLSKAFSYQLTFSKGFFLVVMVVTAIYAILPAPSNPNSLVIDEVFVRVPKTVSSQSLHGSMKCMPLEKEY